MKKCSIADISPVSPYPAECVRYAFEGHLTSLHYENLEYTGADAKACECYPERLENLPGGDSLVFGEFPQGFLECLWSPFGRLLERCSRRVENFGRCL